MHRFIFLITFFISSLTCISQDLKHDSPKTNNPVIPGFFADPSIVEMDGKYFIYATTVSKYMEPVVWISKDLINWKVEALGITGEHFFWAPSVIKGDDGKYYLYHTSGFDFKCHLYIGETPSGPWKKYGFVEEGFDLQIFKGPSTGKIYGLSSDPNSRPRIAEFESNPKAEGYMTKVIKEKSLEGPFFDYTEGSFMVYKNGTYYLMYSGGRCHSANYNIRYSTSKDIWGPYEDAPNNPVLQKNEKNSVYGSGHHSVLEKDGGYYIVYHRQDVYNWPTCSERQVCIDKMEFAEDGLIKKVIPTHKGIDFSANKENKLVNLAFGKPVTASTNTKGFDPEFAVDENYSTRWMSGRSGGASIAVDLGEVYEIHEILPSFFYYDYFTLYKIWYSNDNQKWELYFDQSKIAKKGTAPVEQKKINARYVKIEFVRGEDKVAALYELKIMGKE